MNQFIIIKYSKAQNYYDIFNLTYTLIKIFFL